MSTTTETTGKSNKVETRREMIGLTLPEHIMSDMERAIVNRGYNSKAEFIRRAVVGKLDELGYLNDAE